jgi:hypothetical protein
MSTYFRYTKKKSSGEKTTVARRKTHQCHDQTPGEHQNRHPMTWTHHLEDDVAGYFEERIRNEEQGNSSVVLDTVHLEVIRHTSNLRVTDYSALAIRSHLPLQMNMYERTVTPIDKGN